MIAKSKIFVGLLLTLDFSAVWASAAYSTCPRPTSIYQANGDHPSFAAPNDWHSPATQDFKQYYQKLPKNFPQKIYFVRATLYKNAVLCEYALKQIMVVLVKQKAFKPHGNHWHSAGYSVKDPHFQLFECGHAYEARRYNVQYCKFSESGHR